MMALQRRRAMVRAAISPRLNSIRGTMFCISCGEFTALDNITRAPLFGRRRALCAFIATICAPSYSEFRPHHISKAARCSTN